MPLRQRITLNALDILVLSAFAVAQPLFSLLGGAPGFFVVHHATPADLILLVAAVCLLPAAALIAVELLAAAVSRRALPAAHLAVLSFLLALDLLPIVKRLALPAALSLALALLAGALCASGYARIRTWRWSLAWLSPALLLFPVLLLFFTPVTRILLPGQPPRVMAARIGRPAPIVLVVFDEFPLSSLLDHTGNIDSDLYPNFARLAQSATWYRNVTAVGESTLLSLPSIVSGIAPDAKHPRLPDAASYPNTLFTALGGVYHLNVTENDTNLCPDSLCADPQPAGARRLALLRDSAVLWLYIALPSTLTRSLPDVTQSWKDFHVPPPPDRLTSQMWAQFDEAADWHDRVRAFRSFIASVRPSPWLSFHFIHILLPHAPWDFLPSGQRFALPEARIRGLRGVNDRGEDPNHWNNDPWAVAQSYQRHLVQVSLVDHLVGELVRHLRDAGLYDSTLLIVTADHGASFRPNDSRRSVTPTNFPDIMSVPLFIKYPGQTEGATDDRDAELIDIVPTVFDVLQLRPSWKPEGLSLQGPAVSRPIRSVVAEHDRRFEFPAGLPTLFASVRRKLDLFGGETRADLYRLGDRYHLCGHPAPSGAPPEPAVRYSLDQPGYYASVDLHAPLLLANVTGRLLRSPASSSLSLAVALNGSIRAVTESYRDGDAERFSALVSAAALRQGSNRIGVYAVHGPASLNPIPAVVLRPYSWGEELKFGAGGNAAFYYGLGWSQPEPNLTWTDGHLATIDLPGAPPRAEVVLTARFSAFTSPGRLPRQRVRLLVNHRRIAEWRADGNFSEYTARIPQDVFTGAMTQIAFDLPDATSPASFKAGADSRTLGIAMLSLRLAPDRSR